MTLPNKPIRTFGIIWLYVGDKSPVSADKLIVELFGNFQLLADNAGLGRSRSEFFLNLRSFPFKKYIIFYVPSDPDVEIFRIIHSSRNIENIFDECFDDLKTSENR